MKIYFKNIQELNILIVAFILLATIAIGSKYFGLYQMNRMDTITSDIYEHPLKVSNAALSLQLEFYKMHRDMKDVVLRPSFNELDILIKKVDSEENIVYKHLSIVQKNILGEAGLVLFRNTKELFSQWKPIRDEVISFVQNGKHLEAIKITKGKGAKHVEKLDISAQKLYNYAQIKADMFKKKSNTSFKTFQTINYMIMVLLAILFLFIAYYTIRRLSEFIKGNRQLTYDLNKKSVELETIIQEAPNPMILHNETGDFLLVNRVWEELTGYNLQEVDTIEKWSKKVTPSTSIKYKEHTMSLYNIQEKIDEGEFNVKTKLGKTLIWRFSTAPLGVIDGKKTLITSAMDITELKQNEELMISQSRNAAMGEMISMIAHQWRQPLSVIAMNANNMLVDVELDDVNNDAIKVHSYSILNQADHLTDTINDFKNFFHPKQEKEMLTLEQVLNEVLKIVGSSLKNNNIELDIQTKNQTAVLIHKRELIQVLINLINNAKDAVLSFAKKNKNINIVINKNKYSYFMTICDNGGGIDESIISKVFDPYFTTKKDLNGSGLGLYMSKTIMEKHLNGNITVQNKDNGVCFKVSLRI